MPIRVYVSYAREDTSLLTKLAKHLSSLKREKVITQWDDRRLEAGEDTAESIRRYFETAQVIVLLVSADFLASDMLWELGVNRAIAKRHRATITVGYIAGPHLLPLLRSLRRLTLLHLRDKSPHPAFY